MLPVSDLTADQLDGNCIKEIDTHPRSRLYEHFKFDYDGATKVEELRASVVAVFYEVGLVGLKIATPQTISWSFRDRDVLRGAEIDADTRIAISPMFLSSAWD